MSRSNWVQCSLLAALVALAGCSREEKLGTVPVSGLVMLDNKPVAGATVSFSPDDKGGTAAVGTTDASGRFTLTTKAPGDGAVPGEYGVIITKTVAAAAATVFEDPRGKGRELTPDEAKAMVEAMKASTSKKTATDSQAEIPAKYGVKETSGFKATVAAGDKNEFTFAMAK